MSDFKFDVGDVVVCINDAVKTEALSYVAKFYKIFVIKDRKYTIRGFLHNDGIVVGVLLEEIYNPKIYIKLVGKIQEPAFATWRFRKALPSEMNMVEEENEETYHTTYTQV